VLLLFRDFFRQDMHHPESNDANNWRDDEHDPRNAIRNGVECLPLEKGGVGMRRKSEAGKNGEGETPAARPERLVR
jgi:hypothetical protein